jgi:hypothetical protein
LVLISSAGIGSILKGAGEPGEGLIRVGSLRR